MRIATAVAVACLSVGSVTAAAEVQAAIRRPIHLPEQPLDAALQQLAKDRDVQMIYSYAVVGELRTPGVTGELTFDEALARLLTGTGLGYRYLDDMTVTIVAVPAATSTAIAPSNAPLQLAQVESTSWATPWRARLAQVQTQSASTSAERSRPAELEEVIVTGSNIRINAADADKGATPIEIISASKLQATSGEQVGSFLRQMPFVAGANTQPATDSTNGGRTFINLRGLGSQYTLSLVNGRRFGGDDSSADIGALPPEAIESIEVLKGGASAVYGTSAIGGVVNFKLREKFEGLEFVSSYGNTTNHDASAKRAAMLFGGSADKFSFVGSVSWQERNPIFNTDRDITSSSDFRSYGGTDRRSVSGGDPQLIRLATNPSVPLVLDTSRFSPGQTGTSAADYVPLTADRLIQSNHEIAQFPEESRFMNHWVLSYELLDNKVVLYDQGYYSRRKRKEVFVFPQVTVTVPATNPYNPFGVAATVRYRFGPGELLGYSDAHEYFDTKDVQNVVGIRGNLGEYSYDIGLTNSQWGFDTMMYGEAVTSLVQAAANRTDASAFNPFGYYANTPAQLAEVAPGHGWSTFTKNRIIDAKITGPLFALPAGDARFALAFENRRTAYSSKFDETWRRYNFDWSGNFFTWDPRVYSRSTDAGMLEVKLPAFRAADDEAALTSVELNAATRYENSSDFGNINVSQANVRFGLLGESLIARFSYAGGYRSPTISSMKTTAYVENMLGTVYDPVTNANVTALLLRGGNPNLRPETAKTYNYGLIYTPNSLRELTLRLDYWRILQEKVVFNPVAQDVLLGTSPGGSYSRDPVTGQITIDVRPANGTTRSVSGIDFGAGYSWNGAFGKLSTELNTTYSLSFEEVVNNRRSEYAGAILGTNGPIPRLRGNLSLLWSRGAWDSSTFFHYMTGVHDVLGTVIDRHSKDYWTQDFQIGFRFDDYADALGGALRDLRVQAGAENIWDAEVPFIARNANGWDRSLSDLRGRYWYVGFTKKL